MEKLGELLRRLGYLFSHNRHARELEAEMTFHREMAERAGRSDSRRSFGNTLRLREQSREAWGWTWIDRLFQDLRYASRMLVRSPGFTVAAVLVLAIGIGGNVYVFSLLNSGFLQWLPLRDPASLVRLYRHSPENSSYWTPYPTAIFYRDHAKTLSAVMTTSQGRLELDSDSQPIRGNFVSANFFKELGASATLGRLFDPVLDEAHDAPPVAVLGREFWRQRFKADPTIVGRTIQLNRKHVTIIGVEPLGFPGLGGADGWADVWLPITQQPFFVEGSKLLTETSGGAVVSWARLAPNVTPKMAEQELLTLTNERRKQYPHDIWKDEMIQVLPAGHFNVLSPQAYQGTAIVSALSLLILVVACANLGGLLLARGVAREHEVRIRIAIGANRKRIFRQLFTESLLLAFLGSILGLALAYLALRVIFGIAPHTKWMNTTPDWRVVLFVLGITLITSILFGFAPALQMARQQQKKTFARQLLVGAQVAASCILVIISSLLVRAAQHVIYTDPGFGYQQVVSIKPDLGAHGYTPVTARAYLDQLQSRLRALPESASVSLVRYPPLESSWTTTVKIDGHPVDVYRNLVDPEFFHTMEIPMLLGRNFMLGEKDAIIISESLANRLWPGQNPIGRIYLEKNTVVGVIGNAPINSVQENNTAEIYSLAQLEDMPYMSVVLKSNGASDGLVPSLKSIVLSLDPKLFPEITLLKSAFEHNMYQSEMAALLISLIGVTALLLASIGILGLVAYTVSQRTKEIAIRLALGASSTHVVVSLLRQFSWPVLVGAAAGACGAAAFSQVLRGVLFGVSNLDPLSYASGIALLLGSFAGAALLPARRALKLDVARALHQE